MNQRLRVREAGSHWNDHLDSDECEAKTYARKRYTESQSSIYARSSGSEVVSNAHWLSIECSTPNDVFDSKPGLRLDPRGAPL